MKDWDPKENYDELYARLSADEQRQFTESRGKYKPNAWARVREEDFSCEEQDPYLAGLAEGITGSVHCE